MFTDYEALPGILGKMKLGSMGNWGTGEQGTKTQYIEEQANMGHFRDRKAENKFVSKFRNKGTQANF